MARILAAGGGGGALVMDVALQAQRLTLDIVGLVAFGHDFRQAELTRRRAPPLCMPSGTRCANRRMHPQQHGYGHRAQTCDM